MFMNEARLSARLNHQNIVETNEVFSRMHSVIVMQPPGQPLSMLVARAEQKPEFPLVWHLRVISGRSRVFITHEAHRLRRHAATSCIAT
jgi:serine/threonine-protein kinase